MVTDFKDVCSYLHLPHRLLYYRLLSEKELIPWRRNLSYLARSLLYYVSECTSLIKVAELTGGALALFP